MIRSFGRTGSDAIAPGEVSGFVSNYLFDFVNEVLSSYPHEWGYIYHVGGGSIEYRHNKLLSIIPPSWKDVPVHFVKCSGGWSRMDYYVY